MTLASLFRCGSGNSQTLGKLPKDTQLVKKNLGFKSGASDSQVRAVQLEQRWDYTELQVREGKQGTIVIAVGVEMDGEKNRKWPFVNNAC